MAPLVDIRSVKSILQIPPGNVNEDKTLLFYGEWATNVIENFLGVQGLGYQTRQEYYNGTGTQYMLLKHRPVFPNPPQPYSAITVIENSNGYWGAASGAFVSGASFSGNPGGTTLVYGQDFTMSIDQVDGSSRSAILVRINDYWIKPTARQVGLLSPFVINDTGSYQVTYTAGYSFDTLPSAIQMAATLLVTRMRYLFPLGMELSSENYEERSINVAAERRDYLLALVKPLLFPYRNWKW